MAFRNCKYNTKVLKNACILNSVVIRNNFLAICNNNACRRACRWAKRLTVRQCRAVYRL